MKTPTPTKPDMTRSEDNRTLLCGECARPVLFCQDERTGRFGYVCRDETCPNSRRLLTQRPA